MRFLRFLTAALLLPAVGCVRLSGDLPPVCTTQTLTFNGASPLAAGPTVSGSRTFALGSGVDLSPVSRLRFEGGTISGDTQTSDLSFLDALSLTVQPPQGSSLAPVTVLDWHRSGTGPVVDIAVPASTAALKPYDSASGFSVQMSATGSPPPSGFSLIVDLCMSGNVDTTLSP